MSKQHDILIKNDDAYYDTECSDKGSELGEIRLHGPLAHAPEGFCWADGEAVRRVPQSGEYEAINPKGEAVMLVVKLNGFGTRDKFPGEKVELTPKQKSVIDWKKRNEAKKGGESDGNSGASISRDGF